MRRDKTEILKTQFRKNKLGNEFSNVLYIISLRQDATAHLKKKKEEKNLPVFVVFEDLQILQDIEVKRQGFFRKLGNNSFFVKTRRLLQDICFYP